MRKPRVVLTRRWPEAVEARLAARFDLVCNPGDVPFAADALCEALTTADALCPTVTDRIDAKVLEVAPRRARLIANYGVGINHIDIDTARRLGLTVTNTPGVLTDATADLTLTLLLMAARRAGEGEREVRAGAWTGWRPTHLVGTQVTGKTLGLVGFGRIAQAVARRAHQGFGMEILFHTRTPPEVTAAGVPATSVGLDELLARSDFVSLHCPGGAITRHLINRERLAAMKPSAFLINTARGEVVDEAALIDALATRRIAGAGLDVYADEPCVPAALKALENVVLLPHLGSATDATRIEMGLRVLANLEAFFAGAAVPDRVA